MKLKLAATLIAGLLATTASQVVLSRARRDEEGRLLGASPLLRGTPPPAYLRRNRRPDHAMSETDRLTARPGDASELAQAASAATCWTNWRSSHVTPHDGQVRPDHPALAAALDRAMAIKPLRHGFAIDRRGAAPALARHMSATGG